MSYSDKHFDNLLKVKRQIEKELDYWKRRYEVAREVAIDNDPSNGISIEIPRDMTVKQARKEVKLQIAKNIDEEIERRMKEDK